MDRLIEYATQHPLLVAATLLAIIGVIVYELRLRSNETASVPPQQAIALMNRGALVLDLRSAEAHASGHLAGARQMDSDRILKAGETLKKHKEKPVLVYCDSGPLGAAAARQLATQGFTQAVSLRGGLAGWRAESLPLVAKGKS